MTQLGSTLSALPYRDCLRVSANTPLGEAARQMDERALTKAVVMQGEIILGVFTARERLRAFHLKVTANTPVYELISTAHLTLKQKASVEEACSCLLKHTPCESLLTDDNGRLLGFLNESDLLEFATSASDNTVAMSDSLSRKHAPNWISHSSEQNDLHEELKNISDSLPENTSDSVLDNSSHYVPDVSKTMGNMRNMAGFATDLSEHEKYSKQFHLIKQQTDLISRFAATLINLPSNSSDVAWNRALMEMGKLTQVDRAYIFRYDFDTDTASNTHEWCAPGITPEIDNLQAIPLKSISRWVSRHKLGKNLIVDDVSAMPPGMDRKLLEAQDIKSLACLPLLTSEGCTGFLGLDSVRSKREYNAKDLEVLGLFARTLANYQERVNAEQKLANSEANFHAYFDKSQDLLFVLSLQGEIIQCNTQACRRLGFTREDLCGKSLVQLYPKEHHDEISGAIAKMADSKMGTISIPMRHRFGLPIPVETKAVAGHWNGMPALFTASRDLSDISTSEEKFSKAFQLSPMPLAICELARGTILEINDAFTAVTGYSIEETLGNNISTMNLFVKPDMYSAVIEQVRQLGKASNIEIPLRTRQGQIVHGLFYAVGMKLQGLDVLIFQMMDITGRKAAEEALANEQIRLRTLINSQPNMVWLKDLNGAYLACNALYESMLGLPESEIVGKIDFDLVEEDLAESFRANDVLATEATEPLITEEWITFASNGYRGLFETTKTPIFTSDKQLIGVLGVARDVTTARQADRNRQRIERELYQSQKMESLGQLTGGVAHEFNNMLAIIVGYADLLRTKLGPEIDPSMQSWLDNIDLAGERAEELVRQLLSFSRPREKTLEPINLESAVRNAISLSQGSLPSSIEIDYRPNPGIPEVLLDAAELQQILTNLLVNARDAMQGKGRIEVTLKHVRHFEQECQVCHTLIEDKWVELSVADNGSGIFEAQLTRIFEPFYTTKSVGKGTGLGLSVVQSAVEQSGGHILVNTLPGKGTRFSLLFPPLVAELSRPSPVIEKIQIPSLKTRKVLVVDDEPAITEFLREALEIKGLDVVAITNSREALKLLLTTEQPFDLLITDQTMPDMLGTELAAQAKQRLRNLKVILCTGHSDQINMSNANEFGIDRYLEKPIGIQGLVVAIDALSM